MKKIGVLLHHAQIDRVNSDIIDYLQKELQIELFFLILEPLKTQQSFAEKIYNTLFSYEKKLFSLFSDELKEYSCYFDLPQIAPENIIYCTDINFSGTNILELAPKEIQQIQKLGLDLIVDLNGTFALEGEIIEKGAKDGIVGINYQKKLAFWEIYQRKDTIGFTIEKYKKSCNEVLFSGKVATMRIVSEMTIRLRREAAPYLLQIVEKYLHNKTINLQYEPVIFDTMAYRVPTIFEQLSYIFKTFSLYGTLVYKRILLKKYTRFSVAFLWEDWKNTKLHHGTIIKTPSGHFYADPFVWTKEGRHVCFLEDYDYSQNIAWISAVELFNDGSYKILGEVIKEPFHLSFPYLFEYEDELYMVPESTAAGSIRLYKCIDFPLKWEYQKDLMTDVKAADTMLFYHGDRWWMFTNMTTLNNDDQAAQLFIYYNDSPITDSGWKAHSLNPVVFNSDYGRNGGILDVGREFPIRVRQKQKFNIYGAAFSLAKITKLSPETYAEQYLCDVNPDFFSGAQATHHMHSHNSITVYDFMRHEKL